MKLLTVLLLLTVHVSAQNIHFPLKASDNKKYIVDQQNNPVFLNGTATWRLGYAVTYTDAKKYLADRKAKGYNSLIVEICPDMPVKGGNVPNINGDSAFHHADVSMPNEKYFSHTDSILQLLDDMNVAVVLSPLYLGCCKDGWLEIIQQQPNTVQKCYDYGKWVASRYKHLMNIIWMSGGDHNEIPEAIAYAEGIASVDSIHLHTYHGWPGYTSTERVPTAKWLTLSSTYTYYPGMDDTFSSYMHVYAQFYRESLRNQRMPSIMSESAYEYERNETTQFIRRQAYWTLLSGGSGHIFGNRDTWPMNANWPNALNTPGNESMRLFNIFLKSIPWHTLQPDWGHAFVTAGRGSYNNGMHPGGEDYATAAINKEGTIGVLYMPTYRTVCINMSRFKSAATAKWFDPSNGKYITLPAKYSNKGVLYLTPPSKTNSQGFDDWVLIISASPA